MGYLAGAAQRCGVALEEASALTHAMDISISLGAYGDAAETRALFADARGRGFAQAATPKAECAHVAASLRDHARELLTNR